MSNKGAPTRGRIPGAPAVTPFGETASGWQARPREQQRRVVLDTLDADGNFAPRSFSREKNEESSGVADPHAPDARRHAR